VLESYTYFYVVMSMCQADFTSHIYYEYQVVKKYVFFYCNVEWSNNTPVASEYNIPSIA